jgi:geranylgeranyl pyrophosphate synthase
MVKHKTGTTLEILEQILDDIHKFTRAVESTSKRAGKSLKLTEAETEENWARKLERST